MMCAHADRISSFAGLAALPAGGESKRASPWLARRPRCILPAPRCRRPVYPAPVEDRSRREAAMSVLPPSSALIQGSTRGPGGSDPQAGRPGRRRPWRDKFQDALRGLKLGIRGHSSFFVHFFFAALVLAAAVVLGCSLEQWGILLLCIGLVLTAELFNSALETLFRGLDEFTRERAWPALDIAAGAVLLASLVAIAIGSSIFLTRLSQTLLTD